CYQSIDMKLNQSICYIYLNTKMPTTATKIYHAYLNRFKRACAFKTFFDFT
ncbi:hypothetical protein L9F63_010480, partial [Diploptera punctata]